MSIIKSVTFLPAFPGVFINFVHGRSEKSPHNRLMAERLPLSARQGGAPVRPQGRISRRIGSIRAAFVHKSLDVSALPGVK